MTDSKELLEKTRRIARKEFNRLRPYSYCHVSHVACEALQIAAKKTGFEHYGIEGSSPYDLIYLNQGDTYILTVCFHNDRFMIASWGEMVEMIDRKEIRL